MGTETNEQLQSIVAYEILDYLTHHPESEGSIEAIAEWWLLKHKIDTEVNKVAKAISLLVEKDLLLERKSKDMKIHYRLNKNKINKVLNLLKHQKNTENH